MLCRRCVDKRKCEVLLPQDRWSKPGESVWKRRDRDTCDQLSDRGKIFRGLEPFMRFVAVVGIERDGAGLTICNHSPH